MARPRWLPFAILAVLGVGHLAVVASIVRQPPRVRAVPDRRSVIFPLHHDSVHRAGPGSDFFAVYHAGIKMQRGESPYDGKENPRVTPDYFPFRYLPIVAQTVGRGATLLEPWTAYRVWAVILELLLVACLLAIWRGFQSETWRLVACGALLVSTPYFLEVHIGQFTFATSALLVLALFALDDPTKRLAPAAAVYAAAVILKVFPLVSAAALVRHRRGFIAALVAVLAMAALSVPYFLDHPVEWKAFAATNFGNGGAEGFHGGNYGFLYSLYLIEKALGTLRPAGFQTFAKAWQLAIIGSTALFVFLKRPTMLTGGIALVLAHLLSYKHVWEHHSSGTVVLAVFLLVGLHADRWAGRWVALGCLILLVVPTPFVFVDAIDARVTEPTPSWTPFGRLILPLSKAIPTFGLWLVALIQSHRESAAARRATPERICVSPSPA